MVTSKSSSVRSSIERPSAMPALLISTSIGPSSRSTPATMPFTAAALRDVGADRRSPGRPACGSPRPPAFASAAFVDIVHRHGGAGFGQRNRDGAADAARPAGHQRNPALQHRHSALRVSTPPARHVTRLSTNRSIPHGSHGLRRVPRASSSDRRKSHPAVPPRPQVRRAPGRAGLRRVLVRRASFVGLGDDRLARDVPGRRRRAHQAHQARHRRGLAALSPSLQRGPAHGAARPHDGRPRHLRLGPGRAAVRRPHARHRPDDPARPPGRRDRRHPPPVQGRARHQEDRVVHAAGRGPAAPAAAGGHGVRRRLAGQPVGHDAGRQVRHRHHLAGLDVERRACCRCRRNGASPSRPPPSTAPRSTARTGACCSPGTSPRRARRRAKRRNTA